MTEVNYGLKETKEALRFVISLGTAIDQSLVDKKIGLDDAMKFYTALLSAGEAFNDIALVPAELADMDEAEKAEIVRFVEEELDLRSDRTEEIIERALATAINVYEIVKLVKA